VRRVVVHPDASVLAEAVAVRLLTRILDVQAVRDTVHVVLTGGTVGIATLERAAQSVLCSAIDWTGVHLWWGDERFLPAGDPDRNETQARTALIDELPIPRENVHPIPAKDGEGIAAPDDAAAGYAHALSAHSSGGEAVPRFDVLLLGLGPDGHVASLFPGHAVLDIVDRTVVGVLDSPKPPPERVSLTFAAIRAAREVWIVAAGAEKSIAVHAALAGLSVSNAPAGHATGTETTLWLIDAAAAASA
jgi:6-phosphogluconolactonase